MKEELCLLCFAFHQRKAPFCPLQKTSHNALAIPTLQLEKGVDSSTDSSHGLLIYCPDKCWVVPTTCLQNCPWVQFRVHLFQDSSQPHPWQKPESHTVLQHQPISPWIPKGAHVPLGTSQGRKHWFAMRCCKITAPLFHLQY